jgi:hypothetical protein
MLMDMTRSIRLAVRWLAIGIGLGAASYATYVGVTWSRYGRVRRPVMSEDVDPLLDRFIPEYEVAERHHVRVAAPAEIALSAAAEMDFRQSAIVRAIFRSRELILGSGPKEAVLPRALLTQAKALGWGLLAEIPGREIVVGAVTKPWMANVVFRALPPQEFAAFQEPGYVKIVWTLRADPIAATESVVRTETRVATTDPTARAKFRQYWSFVSLGTVLIRKISLGLVKKEAERRAREAREDKACTVKVPEQEIETH